MKLLSARTAIAVPAALCLAFGGALLTSGAANAGAPTPVAVTAPSAGQPGVQTVSGTTDTVAFTGTAPVGDSLAVTYDEGPGTATSTATVSGYTNVAGTWSADIEFGSLPAGDEHVEATVTALEADGTTTDGTATAVFDLANAPVPAPLVTAASTPTSATIEEASATGFAVTGTNFDPNERIAVVVTAPDGTTVVPAQPLTATADASGDYNTAIVLPETAPGGDYDVRLAGATSNASAHFALAVLADPTITSPTAGEKLTGTSVKFSGTATPGSEILVVLDTTANFASDFGDSATPKAMMKSAKVDGRIVAPKASDPTGTFLPVGADGTWTVTATDVPADDYTFIVLSQDDDGNGNALVNETRNEQVTGAGPVEFTLAAPATTTTASTGGTTATTATSTLAFTGSSDSVPALIGGGLLLLTGLGLVVAARRRRRTLAE